MTYTKMCAVPIKAEAQMLESWAGYDAAQVERELAFAIGCLDVKDEATLRWLACGIERRLADIEATDRAMVGAQASAISGPAYTIDGEGRTRDVYSGELLDL